MVCTPIVRRLNAATPQSPMLRDQEAFVHAMQGGVQHMRIIATDKPMLSDSRIAARVHAAVAAEGDVTTNRPLAELYLSTHHRRVMSGIKKAILWETVTSSGSKTFWLRGPLVYRSQALRFCSILPL